MCWKTSMCKVAIIGMLKILHNEDFPRTTCYLATATRIRCTCMLSGLNTFWFKMQLSDLRVSHQREGFGLSPLPVVWTAGVKSTYNSMAVLFCPSVVSVLLLDGHFIIVCCAAGEEHFTGLPCAPLLLDTGYKRCWTFAWISACLVLSRFRDNSEKGNSLGCMCINIIEDVNTDETTR